MGRHERDKIYREEAFFAKAPFLANGLLHEERGWGQEQETRLGLKKKTGEIALLSHSHRVPIFGKREGGETH